MNPFKKKSKHNFNATNIPELLDKDIKILDNTPGRQSKIIQPVNTIKQLTKEEIKLLADREEWQKQYEHWLDRKNRFALKLNAASKPTHTSKKYQELDSEVKKYWQLLRDSLPAYKAMFVQKGK